MKTRPVSPMLVGFLTLLSSLMFIGPSIYGFYRDAQFEKSQTRVTATLDLLSPGGKQAAIAYYHYVVDGASLATNSEIAPTTYFQLHAGQHVPVKLLENHLLSRLEWPGEDQWHQEHNETGLKVGLFFASIGLFLVWIGRPRQKLRN